MIESLADRQGLPDALRVLLEDYPREAWESSDNFGTLIRFWLDRHLMFRGLMTSLQGETERALDGNLDDRLLARAGVTVRQHAGRRAVWSSQC